MDNVIQEATARLFQRVMKEYKQNGFGKDAVRISGEKELEIYYGIREIKETNE